MQSENRQNCVVCGENQFEYVDGFHYCAVCGAKCELFVDVDEVGEQNLEDAAAPTFALSKLRADVGKRITTKRRKRKYGFDPDYDDLDSSSDNEQRAESTPKPRRKRLRSITYDYAKPFLLADAFTIILRKHTDTFIEKLEQRSLSLPSLLNYGLHEDWRSVLRTNVFTVWKLYLRKRGDAFASDLPAQPALLAKRRARELHAVPVCRPLFDTASRAKRPVLLAKRLRREQRDEASSAETTQRDWTTEESAEEQAAEQVRRRKRQRIAARVRSLRPEVRDALLTQSAEVLPQKLDLMTCGKPLAVLFLGSLFCAPELNASELARFARAAGIRFSTQPSLLPAALQLFSDDIRALSSDVSAVRFSRFSFVDDFVFHRTRLSIMTGVVSQKYSKRKVAKNCRFFLV